MATIDRRKERHMTAIDKENKNDRKRRENAMPLVRSKSTLVILVIVNILQFKEHRHGKMELSYSNICNQGAHWPKLRHQMARKGIILRHAKI
ncbi:hypothetical protein EUGRSUZ_J00736 [Eucalyptus grandis]|uniref:Uncharacterized protein n=2 Tax=Eucalyptus grandis TaxID=71139 RepID=A0ACC3J336_EUCGR|nr:hypothetical protein EUGRSUZ_J00736 [Eucalyptus grandis]